MSYSIDGRKYVFVSCDIDSLWEREFEVMERNQNHHFALLRRTMMLEMMRIDLLKENAWERFVDCPVGVECGPEME